MKKLVVEASLARPGAWRRRVVKITGRAYTSAWQVVVHEHGRRARILIRSSVAVNGKTPPTCVIPLKLAE